MREPVLFLVPLLLAAQAGAVRWLAGAERPPAPPDLAVFPAEIGAWMKGWDRTLDPEAAAVLRADRVLLRTYRRRGSTRLAELFVAWFQSQRAGASQPHSPKVCLPGNGWMPEASGDITIPTAAGAITVNRYVVSRKPERAVVVYWYQSPRRVLAGEWESKLWLVADAARDRRSDTALVRVVVEAGYGSAQEATDTALDFARDAYPKLRENLPR